MKYLYLITFLLIIVIVGCKKDQVPQPNQATNTSTPTTAPATQPSTVLSVTELFPSIGSYKNSIVIRGTNFGTSVSGVSVFFGNGKDSATVLSVTPTEIRVTIPITTPGTVTVKKDNQSAVSQVFNYKDSYLSKPYVNGPIWLNNQSDVDDFVALNKGKDLQITGTVMISNISGSNNLTSLAGLSIIKTAEGINISNVNLPDASFLNNLVYTNSILITSCGFNNLDLRKLQAYPESFILKDMNNLMQVNTYMSGSMKEITISGCPQLTDLDLVNNINTATTVNITNCPQLKNLNFLNGVTSVGTLGIATSPQIANLDFLDNITSASTISIANVGATTVKLNSLTKLGLLSLANNTNFSSIESQSLTNTSTISIQNSPLLTKISFPALTSLTAFSTLGISSTGITDLSGFSALQNLYSLTLNANTKLTSLNGLQSVKTITAAVITNNASLNDLCPFKKSLITLNSSTYTAPSLSSTIKSQPKPALTFTGNGVTDVVTATAACP